MSNNSYMSIWLVAVPAQADAGSQAYRYLWVQGQTNGSLASEQSTQFKDLNIGQLSALFTEFVVIDKVIIQYTAANWTIQEVDKLTGNKVNPGSTPAGSYLSSVSVTAPLTGNGTVASPIAAPQFAGSTAGLVPTSAGGTTNFLRADGSWTPTGTPSVYSSTVGGANPIIVTHGLGVTDVDVSIFEVGGNKRKVDSGVEIRSIDANNISLYFLATPTAGSLRVNVFGSGGVTAGAPVTSVFGRTGGIVMFASDVTTALTYTPINKAGDSGIGNLGMGALTATTGNFSSTVTATNFIGSGAGLTGLTAGIARSVISVSTATTAAATASTDYVYLVSGTTTLTLPTAVGNNNSYTIKNSGSNTVTVATTSGQTIDGSLTAALPIDASITVISDTTNWRII
jgi:hypothetical protein